MTGLPRGPRRRRGDRRVLRLFSASLLAAFGAVSAVIQFVGQLFPGAFPEPGRVTFAAIGLCTAWGLLRSSAHKRVFQRFRHPSVSVAIESGDLFNRSDHLVVGFCDTFDSETDPSGPVHPASGQGQLLARLYGQDTERLDGALALALRHHRPESVEREQDKPSGKLIRYPIGTVATLPLGPRRVFAVAYSRLGNDGVATSNVEDLWFSLNRLWDAVYLHGSQERVAVPLLGTGLARLDFLDEEIILRLIVLSYMMRSRERRVCRELTIVVHPSDLHKIDMREAAAFLRALGAAVG